MPEVIMDGVHVEQLLIIILVAAVLAVCAEVIFAVGFWVAFFPCLIISFIGAVVLSVLRVMGLFG